MKKNYLKGLNIYYAGRESCVPGYSFGPAIRQHYLLHVILSGKGIYQKGGQRYNLNTADAFLIVPGERCYYAADRENPWEYAWIGFDGYEVPEILKDCNLSSENPVYSNPEKTEWMDTIVKLVEEIYKENTSSKYRIVSFAYALFADMCQRKTGLEANSYEKEYLNRAKEYIQQNYMLNVKISDVAKTIGIDRSYLYRLFEKSEAMSPKQYLTGVRLEAALYMLANSKYSIMEIASFCGFWDSASFCNAFKRHYYKTPREYRKEQRASRIEPPANCETEIFVLP